MRYMWCPHSGTHSLSVCLSLSLPLILSLSLCFHTKPYSFPYLSFLKNIQYTNSQSLGLVIKPLWGSFQSWDTQGWCTCSAISVVVTGRLARALPGQIMGFGLQVGLRVQVSAFWCHVIKMVMGSGIGDAAGSHSWGIIDHQPCQCVPLRCPTGRWRITPVLH